MSDGTSGAPGATIVAPPGAPAGGAPASQATEQKPTLLAGKYANREELAKGIREARKAAEFEPIPDKIQIIGEDGLFADDAAGEREYARLQKLISSKKPADTKPGEPAAPMKIGGEPLPENADVPTVINKAGLKLDELVKQYTEKGDLTDDQYKAIRAVRPGWSKADIKFMADGLQAKAELRNQQMAKVQGEAAEVVGGKEQLASLLTAAKTFVPPEKQAAIDAFLHNPDTAVYAVKMLKQMHAESIGAGGATPVINGQSGASVSSIKTVQQYKELERRYTAGETHLWDLINSVDPNTLALH